MAMICIEGFDHEATSIPAYTQTGQGNQMNQKTGWTEPTENPINFVAGRLPYGPQSHGITVIQNNPLQKVFTSTYTSIVIGMGIRFGTQVFGSGANYSFFNMNHNGTTAVSLRWNYDFTLSVYDSAGALKGTGTTQIDPSVWVYIELKLSTTHAELHLDGNSVSPEIPSVAGSFGSGINALKWEPSALGADMAVDDVYVLETTTLPNNDFLGDTVIETLYPSADGTYTQWTPDSGTSHYPRVNEYHLDGDTSYVHTTTAGNKDTYDMSPTLYTTPVYAVQLNLGARKNDAGARTISPLIRQGGVDYTTTASNMSASYKFTSWLLNQDPSGSDWTYTTVNSDEFGAELVS